jgi:hypothetical protein
VVNAILCSVHSNIVSIADIVGDIAPTNMPESSAVGVESPAPTQKRKMDEASADGLVAQNKDPPSQLDGQPKTQEDADSSPYEHSSAEEYQMPSRRSTRQDRSRRRHTRRSPSGVNPHDELIDNVAYSIGKFASHFEAGRAHTKKPSLVRAFFAILF